MPTKHISPHIHNAFFSALFSQTEFISLEVLRALWISAHQIELIDAMNPGTGPRNGSLKK